MLPRLRRRLRAAALVFPRLLARLGLVDREIGEDAFDLALPTMVTGGIRIVNRAADFFMISIALGDAAVAALELGFQYYFLGFGTALGISSGTISLVSRLKGAGDHERADLAVKQSVWLVLLVGVPLAAATWFLAEPMIALLNASPRTVRLGGIYLRIVMLSFPARFFSMVAARALAGAGNTRTPMHVRLLTVPTNIALNAVLIFGLGPFPRLGVAGAALGTFAANVLAAQIFVWLLLERRFGVGLHAEGPQVDGELTWELLRVGTPLASTHLVRTVGRFPFLFVLATLGTGYVAAYGIGRRVMLLALMPAWGYSTAASTLVGQSVGAGDVDHARRSGWHTLRIGLVTQILIGVGLVGLASPIVGIFNTGSPALTVAFFQVFGVGVIAYSVSRTMRGALRGAGDARWPLYGTMLGTGLRLAIAIPALPAGTLLLGIPIGFGLGAPAVFAAILVAMYTPAVVNTLRFAGRGWERVARASGVGMGPVEPET